MTLSRSRHKRRAERASGGPRTAERKVSGRVVAAEAPPPPTTLPTAERVARAGGAVERGESGRIRIVQAPLDMMRSRNRITDLEHDAGKRYREHWYASGLAGVASSGYEPVIRGESSTPWLIPVSERAAFFRSEWREAYRVLSKASPTIASVIGCVVLDEMALVEAGRLYAGKEGRVAAITAATEMLRRGLGVLVEHYGLLAREKHRRIRAERYPAA